jgi:SAM-dependent methyltransferase
MHYLELESSIYDQVYSGITADIPFWEELATEYCGENGEALELACGTLRVMLPVAEAGVRVTGIDESPHMLAVAQKKLEKADPEVRARIILEQADMRSFELGKKFNLIYVPFNTFGLLLTIEDQLAVLAAVKKHLASGGVFAFDVFVPDVARMHGSELSRWQLEFDESFSDGSRVQRDNVREIDTRRQILSVTWRNRVYQNRVLEQEFVSDLKLTYFFPRELENLLARAGYEIVSYWGNYQRQDFWKMSEPWKQILVSRPLQV